jgi:hypothetical protein
MISWCLECLLVIRTAFVDGSCKVEERFNDSGWKARENMNTVIKWRVILEDMRISPVINDLALSQVWMLADGKLSRTSARQQMNLHPKTKRSNNRKVDDQKYDTHYLFPIWRAFAQQLNIICWPVSQVPRKLEIERVFDTYGDFWYQNSNISCTETIKTISWNWTEKDIVGKYTSLAISSFMSTILMTIAP